MKIYEPNVSIFNFIAPKSIVQKCPPLENVTKKFMKFRKKKKKFVTVKCGSQMTRLHNKDKSIMWPEAKSS